MDLVADDTSLPQYRCALEGAPGVVKTADLFDWLFWPVMFAAPQEMATGTLSLLFTILWSMILGGAIHCGSEW